MTHRIFKKYRVVNPETEFMQEQVEKLKKIYEEELAADKFFDVSTGDNLNYMKDFQEFDKPPVVPEEVAQTEFYRPNPAAFQKRMNDNPYSVDVGFASLENPIYTKIDDFPARMNIRANSEFYNPQERFNHRVDYQAPSKPFVQNLNMKIYEKGMQQNKLDELIMKSNQLNSGNMGQNFPSMPQSSGRFGSSQTMMDPQNQQMGGYKNQANRYDMYDLLREPQNVKFAHVDLSTYECWEVYDSSC